MSNYPLKLKNTPGQRVVKKGIELSLNMAPEVKIVERNLGPRLFAYKKRLLMHSGIHKRSRNVVLSKAELKSFLLISNSSIFDLLSGKLK